MEKYRIEMQATAVADMIPKMRGSLVRCLSSVAEIIDDDFTQNARYVSTGTAGTADQKRQGGQEADRKAKREEALAAILCQCPPVKANLSGWSPPTALKMTNRLN
jgi:hypothetical protein